MKKNEDEKFLVVVECAIEYQEKFLIIERPASVVHAGGLLAFPGGKVEKNDGQSEANILLEAVKREVFEEVGLALLDPLQIVTSSYFFIDTHQTPVIDVIFYCLLKKTNPSITASAREVSHFAWMSLQEILAHEKSPIWLKRYISALLPLREQAGS